MPPEGFGEGGRRHTKHHAAPFCRLITRGFCCGFYKCKNKGGGAGGIRTLDTL